MFSPASRRSIRFAVCWLLAAFAVQCLAVGAFLAVQDAHAHDRPTGERARQDVMHLAYLTQRARDGTVDGRWRSAMRAATAALARGVRQPVVGLPLTGNDAHAYRALRADGDALVAAARTLTAEPGDGAAGAVIDRLVPIVAARLDERGARRDEVFMRETRLLVVAVVAGFVVESGLFGWLWLGAVRPEQRRLAQSHAELEVDRAQLSSLFEQNPDAIAVYDTDRMLVATNHARCLLMGLRAEEMLGRPLRAFVEPWRWADADTNFERALRGEYVVTDTQLRAADGTTIDVEVSVFPHVVNGAIRGVISASRDVSALVYAKRRSDEVAGRLAALCEIASAGQDEWLDQVRAALQLVADELGFEHGIVAEIDPDRHHVTALATSGEPPGIVIGRSVPFAESLSRFVVGARDVWSVSDLKRSAFIADTNRRAQTWRAAAGIALHMGGSASGTLVLADAKARRDELHATDRHFLKITAALLTAVIDRGRHTARLDSLAFTDALTGLANRAALERRLETLITEARRCGDRFAIHYIDLDRFKAVNDGGGHDAGDAVLRETARRMRGCARSGDMVGRLGGDEFVILQPGAGGHTGAGELAERIIRAVEEPYAIGAATFTLGCSIGISVFPDDGDAAATLMRRADLAMYAAKSERDSAAIFAA